MAVTESLLFMGHGSRDADAVDECMDMVSDLEKSIGQRFTPGFLELSKPLLFPELVRQIHNGVRRFLCFPNMLLPGRHTMEHLPGVLGWAKRHFPEVEFYYGNCIGNHPYALDILYNNYQKALRELGLQQPDEDLTLVVVGRGSLIERSNRTFEKLVRRFHRDFPIPEPDYCYYSLAEPQIPETLDRILQHRRTHQVILLPFFMFTGVLVKRIHEIANDFDERHPDVEFVVGDYLGKDERLKDILEDRIRKLLDQSRSSRENDFRAISEQAGHHLHHLDIYGEEPAADYLQDIPGCPEHRHPASTMENYSHDHFKADHRGSSNND